MSKVFIYGVDGGSFTLIRSFMEHGYLPNFRRLAENGAFGKFKSTIPPHTAPGWATIATGVNPGTHGIYQFWKTNGKDYIGSYQGSKDWMADPIWKILGEYNLKSGIINVPMTHPPKELDGFMISWPLSKSLNYCYPPKLLKEIMQAGGQYYPDIYLMYNGKEEYIQSALDITKKRITTIKYLVQKKEWDFFMTVFPEVDRISHYYWHFMDSNSPYYKKDSFYKDAVLKIYCEVDRAMGEIIDFIPEDTLFVSLSDHGFQVGTINFNIDSFLVEKGYMKLEKTEEPLEIEKNEFENNFNWFTTSYDGENYKVDWSQTKCFIAAPGSYGINFNLRGRQSEGIVCEGEKGELFKKLRKDLLAVPHPYKDSPLFRDVVLGSEVYKGKSSNLAPDILLIPDDYSVMVSHHLRLHEIFSEPEQKGMHSRDGYILFYGNGVKKGKLLDDSELADLAPAICSYYGIEIPCHMEGKELNVFEEEFIKNVPVRTKKSVDGIAHEAEKEESYSKEERCDIEQRLRGLGYL